MAQDPANFNDENEFSRALFQNPRNKFVNAPKPKGRDTRVLASAKSGLGRNFTNIQEANAELNRLQAFDPERLPDKLSSAL